ncbi:MAG TPA: M67 family metallopeptidase [Nitrososphaera sp.]|jgi:[CysO sulfur-carrier protein]-S-L-cysteine hydrolase|nr:M67 family metallopeptidase [Nitrososphaera sp.]
MTTITLTSRQFQELLEIAKHALPNESCAFLLGEHNNGIKVSAILPMRNADESPVTFSIDPVELLNAYNLAENKGMEIAAIFHSHPAKASPSSTDRMYMQINPVVWLIYSTTENEVKAFVYEGENIREIAIMITDSRV